MKPAQEPPPGAAPPRCGNPARKRGGRTGSDRASFHSGRPRRSGDRMVGKGGRPGAAPLGFPGGDRPSRQGDRHGGQDSRSAAGGGSGGSVEPEAQVKNRLRPSANVVARACSAEETRAASPGQRFRGVWRGRDGSLRGLWPNGKKLHTWRIRRGEEIAETFSREAGARPHSLRRARSAIAGFVLLFAGKLEARAHLERALTDNLPGRRCGTPSFWMRYRSVLHGQFGDFEWASEMLIARLPHRKVHRGRMSRHGQSTRMRISGAPFSKAAATTCPRRWTPSRSSRSLEKSRDQELCRLASNLCGLGARSAARSRRGARTWSGASEFLRARMLMTPHEIGLAKLRHHEARAGPSADR